MNDLINNFLEDNKSKKSDFSEFDKELNRLFNKKVDRPFTLADFQDKSYFPSKNANYNQE